MSKSGETKDHELIKEWVESRNGIPAKIKGTGKNQDEGILRIHFPDNSENDEQFEEISWDDFFENFDKNKLIFLYQDEKDSGEKSTFHKFIRHEN